MFVDRAKIAIQSGRGGNGAVSFRREPFVPDGGPDGGDGGRGGDVIFRADGRLHTLMDFRYKKNYAAAAGQDGMKRRKSGQKGEDLVIDVPLGTVVIDEETGAIMRDLTHSGDSFAAAKGGKGGKGNVHFKNAVRQAPNFAEAGGEAMKRTVVLELKLIADVGIAGFPNAGKSTLLSAVTDANPKIGNYHFTTKTPNLGVVRLHDDGFIIADIPGLIEGAHKGVGLGLDFLKHIERTKVIIHVVDAARAEGRKPAEDFETINRELASYSPELLRKPQLVAANKTDLIAEDDPALAEFRAYIEGRGYELFPISAATGEGVQALMNAAAAELRRLPELPETFESPGAEEFLKADPAYRDVNISMDGDIFVLRGKQLEKLLRSTNFQDSGSVRYLHKHLEKRGVIAELKKMGISDSDTIRIADCEFEYYDE
ncbi:MAG: GTPase ObgE [Clostridiales Family XIII bacterium]|nr:GTPase ObgE [Clostridiales Family XIII bacterium]